MQISISDLRQVFDKILCSLENSAVDVVELSRDYYWNIPEDQMYNILAVPETLDVGQLSDEWNNLIKLLDVEEEAIAYHLVWLSAILRAVGDQLSVEE